MGLSTTHDCWQGPYSMFDEWRHWLARFALGKNLDDFEGYFERIPNPALHVPDGAEGDVQKLTVHLQEKREQGQAFNIAEQIIEAALRMNKGPRSWEELGDEPLVILFNHSDCDGEIAAKDCAPLADRMEQVLCDLPKKWERDAEFYECTLQFIEGLRRAASLNEDVVFA